MYLTIEFDEANNWIYNKWVGISHTDKVIQDGQAIIDFLRENLCHNIPNDNREVIGSWSSANEWITQTWVP